MELRETRAHLDRSKDSVRYTTPNMSLNMSQQERMWLKQFLLFLVSRKTLAHGVAA